MKFKYFEGDGFGHISALFFVVCVGVYLRFHNLGALSIWNNEDYLAISVKSILENGLPVFPSGIVYPRALPFSYLSSLFVKWGEGSEFYLRAPGAVFSSLNIILTYIFARQILGRSVALLAAAIMSVFYWEIYTSHMARMYAMFTFSVLLSLVAIYAAEVDDKRQLKYLAFISLVLAAFLHQLAIALILMLLVYAPFLIYKKKSPKNLLPYFGVLLVAIVANKIIVSHYYGQWNELVTQSGSLLVLGEKQPDFLSVLISFAAPLYIQLHSILNGYEKAMFYVAGVAVFLVPNYFIKSKVFKLGLGSVVLALLFQQILIAIEIIGLLYFAQIWLKDNYKWRDFFTVFFVFIVGALLWLVFALVISDTMSIKAVIKELFPYPLMFFRLYLDGFLWLSIACVISCIYVFSHISRCKRFDAPVFLIFVFLVPLIALGYHPDAIARMYERYIYFLNPFFIIIISYGVVELMKVIVGQYRKKHTLLALTLSLMFVVFSVFSYENVISRTLSFSERHYGENADLYNKWLGSYYFHPDNKGGALFVADNYRKGDVVIAMDILAYYSYFSKVDYQLSLSGKKDAEGWIGVKSIGTEYELKQIFNEFSGRRIWVVTSALHERGFRDKSEFREIMKLLEEAGALRYTGQDGLTKVYCIACD